VLCYSTFQTYFCIGSSYEGKKKCW
jgi:hypothetical protein